MCPGHTKLFKRTLVMKHHSIAIDVSVFDSIFFDPTFEQRFGLIGVTQDHNVQWFYRTVVGYGH
jgi:hypothetical protein